MLVSFLKYSWNNRWSVGCTWRNTLFHCFWFCLYVFTNILIYLNIKMHISICLLFTSQIMLLFFRYVPGYTLFVDEFLTPIDIRVHKGLLRYFDTITKLNNEMDATLLTDLWWISMKQKKIKTLKTEKYETRIGHCSGNSNFQSYNSYYTVNHRKFQNPSLYLISPS